MIQECLECGATFKALIRDKCPECGADESDTCPVIDAHEEDSDEDFEPDTDSEE